MIVTYAGQSCLAILLDTADHKKNGIGEYVRKLKPLVYIGEYRFSATTEIPVFLYSG